MDVSREKVGKLFGDPDNLAKWQPGFQSIEPMDVDPEIPHKRYRLNYVNGKRKIVMIESVEVDALPDEYTAKYEAPGMEMRVKNRFEELGPEKTRWITDNEAQTSGFLMRLVGFLMPGCFKKESYKYMVNFKAFAETGADVRDA